MQENEVAGFSGLSLSTSAVNHSVTRCSILIAMISLLRSARSSLYTLDGQASSDTSTPPPDRLCSKPAAQHHVSGGMMQSIHGWDVVGIYHHALQNSIASLWILGQGAVPGTDVTSKTPQNSVSIGLAKSV